MKIKSIGIIGGTHGIGESFANFFKEKYRNSMKVMVSGRNTKITNKKIVQECDLVIFSVPISVTEQVIKESLKYSRKNQIWADFTSVKKVPVELMLQSKAEVCGMHPMFAPTKAMVGQNIIFTPARISAENLKQLKEIFAELEILTIKSAEHDQIMAIVQGLSHLSDLTMGATLKNLGADFKKVLKFSSPPYRLKLDVLGRMFPQNSELYANIATSNPETIKTTQKFQEAFSELKKFIDNKDAKGLAQEFEQVLQFLGKDFCQEAFMRSQRILSQQNSLHDLEPEGLERADMAIFGNKDSHTDEASFSFPERKKSKTTA